MAYNGHVSTSSKNCRFSDVFDFEDSFDDEDMTMGTYTENLRTRSRYFEPMARKKAGSEVGETDGDNLVNPCNSGGIGRLQNVE